ncbi:polysaccharide deacetylase family protein [Chitinophaga vietnamensis]|uniref:polysaccharide deacetylase family protein n=1 Tax=Chitinophaga vietnamensis TaxID=2593957 RepID=UPI0011774AAF|nr:polysaccharide deacetylase family protein [Chitinophaga vietnamensis]
MKRVLLLIFCVMAYARPVCQEVPVLCYHNIFTGNSYTPGPLRISADQLDQQFRSLAENGYHSISPDELLAWIQGRKQLPPKPVMITFDDSHATHYTLAAPILARYGFKAVFFVMTVTIGKQGYLSSAQIKALSDKGHVIGCHTWDHQPLASGNINWQQQLTKPKAVLEKITGRPVNYFAYPYGEWNMAAIEEIKAHGFLAAFQLSNAQSSQEPIFTIRRMIVAGNWSGTRLLSKIEETFPPK